MKNKLSSILLLIGLLCSIGTFSQEKTLKILSYNVYWGMKEDTTANKSKFAEWIKAQNADIVALQEMNGFTATDPDFIRSETANKNNLAKLARSYGHPYCYIVREPAPDGAVSFPVAITSKYPIVNVRRVLDNTVHGFLEAEIEGYHFLVTHFHPFSSERRGTEIDQILATIASKPAGQKWFFMGDLNSVSPLDKAEYDNNLLRDFIKEDRKKRPHNLNLGKDDELDYSVQQKILDFGFVDALKVYSSGFIATAPTKMFYDQSKHPLRYDYLYVSKNLKDKLVKCEVIKDGFTDIYSDHYPVMLTIRK